MINFKLVPKDLVDEIIASIKGSETKDSRRLQEEASTSQSEEGILNKLFMIIGAALLMFVLIVILAVCLIKYKSCPSCIQKILLYFKNKLMYSGILRAIIMLFLGTAVATCLKF